MGRPGHTPIAGRSVLAARRGGNGDDSESVADASFGVCPACGDISLTPRGSGLICITCGAAQENRG